MVDVHDAGKRCDQGLSDSFGEEGMQVQSIKIQVRVPKIVSARLNSKGTRALTAYALRKFKSIYL
jgi:hypothetical protein